MWTSWDQYVNDLMKRIKELEEENRWLKIELDNMTEERNRHFNDRYELMEEYQQAAAPAHSGGGGGGQVAGEAEPN